MKIIEIFHKNPYWFNKRIYEVTTKEELISYVTYFIFIQYRNKYLDVEEDFNKLYYAKQKVVEKL